MKLLGAKHNNTCQTLFEFLTVYICLLTFPRSVCSCGVIVGGDNLSSVQSTFDRNRTRPAINLVGREIAWRKAWRCNNQWPSLQHLYVGTAWWLNNRIFLTFNNAPSSSLPRSP